MTRKKRKAPYDRKHSLFMTDSSTQSVSAFPGVDRVMRREDRHLSDAQALEVINACQHAVLSTCDKDGYPYGVGITPVMEHNCLYFHSSAKPGGRKEDNLLANPNVSVCFISKDFILPEDYACDFASVVIRGKAVKVTDEQEREKAVRLILKRYAPHNDPQADDKTITETLPFTAIWRIDIEHLSGKARAAKHWLPSRSATELQK